MTDGVETLKVITSGGFAAVYRDVLPEFEQRTGIRVETGSGASEGSGPKKRSGRKSPTARRRMW